MSDALKSNIVKELRTLGLTMEEARKITPFVYELKHEIVQIKKQLKINNEKKNKNDISENKDGSLNIKIISKTIGNIREAIIYKEILKIKDKNNNFFKLRILIRSDSYQPKSFAFIYKWDGEKWNQLDFINYSEMKTPHKIQKMEINKSEKIGSTSTNFIENNNVFFAEDRDCLLNTALDLLFD